MTTKTMARASNKAKHYTELITKFGKDLTGDFRITDQNGVPLMSLMEYFAKDPTFLRRSPSYSLEKGLMIQGPVGTGKTMAMKLFRNLMAKHGRGYRVITCRHIVREFLEKGHKILETYGRRSFEDGSIGRRPLVVCFDDLGLEDITSKQYGNETRVMAEILLDRYDHMIEFGMITHVTTNLGAEALGQIYGERVRDRMREMFNQVNFAGKSFRS